MRRALLLAAPLLAALAPHAAADPGTVCLDDGGGPPCVELDLSEPTEPCLAVRPAMDDSIGVCAHDGHLHVYRCNRVTCEMRPLPWPFP